LDIVQKEGKFNQNPKYWVNIGKIFAFWAHKNVTLQFSKMGHHKSYFKYFKMKGGEEGEALLITDPPPTSSTNLKKEKEEKNTCFM
jgi:hypothetical protein